MSTICCRKATGLTIAAGAGLLPIYLGNAGLMAVVTYWGHMQGINIETTMRAKAFDHSIHRPTFMGRRVLIKTGWYHYEILRKASAYFAQAELDRRFKP